MKDSVCLTIRDCPAQVHRALEASARRNDQSIRKEAIQWLQEKAAAVPAPVSETVLLRRIKARKMKTSLNVQEIDAARRFGRK